MNFFLEDGIEKAKLSCKDKDDLFRWMNAVSLASIGYDAEEGKTIGIKKNRYNSCSIRMNRGRKIFKVCVIESLIRSFYCKF